MKIRRKLVIDVTYDGVKKADVDQLESNLNFVASHAMGEGLLTNGVDHVVVDTHVVRLCELEPCTGKVVDSNGRLDLLKDGTVQGLVKLDLSSLLEDDKVLEYFLDALSEQLTDSGLLSDIDYQVVDVEDGSTLVVEVNGDPSMIKDGHVAKLLGKANAG